MDPMNEAALLIDSAMSDVRIVDCPACKGTGKQPLDLDCDKCNATGKTTGVVDHDRD